MTAPMPCECRRYDEGERYCEALDTWEVCCAGCLHFEAKHIAPPEPPPHCFACRGQHDPAWSCDGEPLFKP